jgi:xanthine dehydrogenase accessory factor
MAFKEINDIIAAFDRACELGKRAALATVVHVEGSSYRRPGARMLVTDDGVLTGAISGGCLEGDALQKAMFALHRRTSMLVTYDTMDEDDAKLGVQLGCNGVIQVLFEPIDPGDPKNPVELLKMISEVRQPTVLVTLFSLKNKRATHPGTCMLLRAGELIDARQEEGQLPDVLRRDMVRAISEKMSAFRNYISSTYDLTAFIELVPPPIHVVVIGAGNDVIPLVKMADVIGWKTTVVDGRTSLARPERFVPSCQVFVSKPENVLDRITIDQETAVLLMTHNYNYDLAMLRSLITRHVTYIGSLGPRVKLDRMLDELRGEGAILSPQQLRHLYGPSGLEIGAETPEEIALSILAEIKAVFARKAGGSLRENDDVIHSRTETLIEKVRL